jgi:hypothetical protein
MEGVCEYVLYLIILENWLWSCELDSYGSEENPTVDCCELNNSVEAMNFLCYVAHT